MGLESGTFIGDLVSTNPVGASDDFNQGDDHLRLIKAILQTTFPNASQAFRFPAAPTAKTVAYQVLVGDENALIQGDVSGGAFAITLPLLSAVNNGFEVQIMKSDSGGNALTIEGAGAETINGASNLSLSNQFDFAAVKKGASDWKVIGRVDAGSAITASSSTTFTNKVIALGTNTISGNTAAFNTALTDGNFATLAGTEEFTNKTFNANGTGNSLSNVDVADLANGTDGELITWSAAAAPTTVAVGTAGEVLTSNGVGAAPSFQAVSSTPAAGSVGRAELGTSTGSSSGSLTDGTLVNILLDAYSFFPSISGNGTSNFDFRVHATNGGADGPRFAIFNNDAIAHTYNVSWRFVAA